MDSIEPKAYLINNEQQRKTTMAMLNEFAEELKKMCGSCIDVGCGPGNITTNDLLPMLNRNATITGVDISKNMIEYANEKYKDERRIAFKEMDIQSFNLTAKDFCSYDHIFSFYTLHWCNEKRRTFQNLYNMLKPKGHILINMVCHHDIFVIMKNLAMNAKYTKYMKSRPSLLQTYTNPELEMKALLSSIGYKILHCSIREMETRYEEMDQFASMILSISALFVDIPKQLEQQFQEDFIRAYKKINKQRNPTGGMSNGWNDKYLLFVFHGLKDI